MTACIGALIAGLVDNAQAQTPITAFTDVAGKWKGSSSTGILVSLEIEPNGKFNAETSRGKDFGTGKIEGGQAVFTMSRNPIRLQLSEKGDSLEGSGASGQNQFSIAFTRVGQ